MAVSVQEKSDSMNFMIFEDNELGDMWAAINDMQMLFHPKYSQQGELSYAVLREMQRRKGVSVFLDRNLFSSLLNLVRRGALADKKEQRIISLLMAWCACNDVTVSPGIAIFEHAGNTKDQYGALSEVQLFGVIYDFYPPMIWLRLFQGVIDEIPRLNKEVEKYETSVDYTSPPDHFLMHLAEILHLVYLLRTPEMTRVERICDFLEWNYDNLLICESTIVYALVLLTNQENIRSPRNCMTNNMDKIMEGCRNQAWDLTYLSVWSGVFYCEEKYPEYFLFATNDTLLKRIFIQAYAGNVNRLLGLLLTKSERAKVEGIICSKGSPHRIKPCFGENSSAYFRALVAREKSNVLKTIGT